MKDKKIFFSLFLVFLIWFGIFGKFWFKGLVPVPLDIPVGMYYPWINESFGYPVRVPVKNPILTDTVSQFWIWRIWAVDNLKLGISPFWNPFSFCGYSMSTWFHTVLFFPLNIFFLFTNTPIAMGFIVCLQILVILIASFIFIFELTKSCFSSLFGAISFAFSSFIIGWMTWGTVDWTIAFLPLILFFLLKIINNKQNKPLYFLGFIFSFLFSFLGGHPQTFLYVFFIVLIFILCHIGSIDNKKIFSIVISFFLFFGLTCFVSIPSVPIIGNSIRAHENYIQSNDFGFMKPSELLTLIFSPNFFGNPATGNYWGQGFNFQEKLAWFGSIAFALSFYSILSIIRNKKRKNFHIFLLVVFFAGIFLSLKYPFGFLVYKLHIPFLSTSSASRALLLTIFSGSVLSSLAIFDFIKNQKNKFAIKWTLIFIFSLIVSIIFSVLFSFLFLKNHGFKDFLILKIAARNSIIPILSCFPLLIFLAFNFKNILIKKFFLVLFFLTAVFEGLFFFFKYTPFVDIRLFFPSTRSLDFIKDKYKQGDFFRIERERAEILPPNMWQQYGFYSASGYDPIYPLSYADYLIEKDVIEDPTRYIELMPKDLKANPEFGIKYFFGLKRNKDGYVDKNGSLPKSFDTKQWKQVFEDGAVVVLEKLEFQKPYFLIDNSGNRIFDGIKLIKHKDDDWIFEIENKFPAKFILMESNDKNWKATVNGKNKLIADYEKNFKSVDLKSGYNVVNFHYENILFKTGSVISLLSLVSLIIFLIYLWKRR